MFYDTCALLHDAKNIFNKDEKFFISSITLEELENIKTSSNKDEDIKYQARIVTRLLSEKTDKYVAILYNNIIEKLALKTGIPINNDLKIICSAWYAKEHYLEKDETLVFSTKDLNCSLLASSQGLTVNTIVEEEEEYCGYEKIQMTEEELAEFYSKVYTLGDNKYNLLENEYLFITNENDEIIDSFVYRDNKYQKFNFPVLNTRQFGKVTGKDPYQIAALDALQHSQLCMLRGPAGSGKAQPNSTLIPTKNGYIKLGNIKVGDFILDRFGNETQVLAVYPQGLKENYKISFSDGRVAYCNNEHLWSCYTSKGKLKNFTVQEMIDNGLQTKSGEWRYKIPVSAPVEYSKKQFEIDPYVIGAFLGDGCCKESSLTISSADEELVSEIARLIGAIEYEKAGKFNYKWKFYSKEKTGIKGIKTRFQTADFFKKYSSNLIQLAQNKSIPEEYKFGSIQQRYSLIQGLMDTDGTIDNAQKGRTSFTSTSIKLITDLQEICWSLGMSASISEDRREEKYTGKVCYRLIISCKKEDKPNLFRLKRKKDIAIKYANNNIKSIHSNKLTIKSIEKMPHLEEMTCILVDNEEHLYLTEQYIVTHNTYLAFSYLFDLYERGIIDKIIIFCNTIATKGSAKLGYYPGSRDEKLLDSQIGNLLSSKLGDRSYVEKLLEEGDIVLLPMSDIRGFDTTGMHAGIYITEAQNLDIELMRLALQRIGEDSICILDGDSNAQVDSALYAGANNGMRRVSEVFKGQPFYSEITLNKIHRSKIAELAQNM